MDIPVKYFSTFVARSDAASSTGLVRSLRFLLSIYRLGASLLLTALGLLSLRSEAI
jgi:hypothetical protein